MSVNEIWFFAIVFLCGVLVGLSWSAWLDHREARRLDDDARRC